VDGTLEYLSERVTLVEHRLLARAAADARSGTDAELDARVAVLRQRVRALEARDPSLPIHRLRARAGLSELEEEMLWLVTAPALDPHLSQLVTSCHGDVRRELVTPWLCLRILCDTRPARLQAARACDPTAPLFATGLVRSTPREGVPTTGLLRELVPASFVCHLLRGDPAVGEEIAPFARRTRPAVKLGDLGLHSADRKRLAGLADLFQLPALDDAWAGLARYDFQRGAAVLITGAPGCGKSLAARALCCERGRGLLELDAGRLAGLSPPEAGRILELGAREAALTGDVLLLDGCDALFRESSGDNPFLDCKLVTATFRSLLERLPVTVLLTARSPDLLAPVVRERLLAQHELRPLTREHLELAWQVNIPEAVTLAPDVDFRGISERFALTGRGIQNAVNLALRGLDGNDLGAERLEQAAAVQQASGVGGVAKRSWVSRTLEDLLLPEATKRQIDEIIATERIREMVLEDWGLARRMHKGLGVMCLFDGDPGTGKTLAAEVIANELGIALYTVDISHVVSKWVGETEKNLQRIFDEAQKNRCVILFDEADTLFSKRTDVVQAIDRYSNMEVGLLLQLVEAHRGVVILTTNLKDTMDPAFNRRLAFKVSFPFPDADGRLAIWERLIPGDRCAPDVNLKVLARGYELSGGSIRTVVLRAAYRAAVEGGLISSAMLSDLALHECKTLGKLVRV
jgi:SpoVK/Ycf46/Vps4 family AAA+-type ATPase